MVYGDRGDPDLVLHYAVVQQHGWAGAGAPPVEIVGDIDRATIEAQLVAELWWAADRAPTSYAVLNACRALRFVADGTLCAKSEGGRWALGVGLEPAVVRRALSVREAGRPDVDIAADRAWVRSVAATLDRR
ncbi:MAG: DUF4111 domain-containing protein [Acidimicrobiales bacterium]|nr:DUF4111 domain-containing protein [Acidimicrobiales bacterium]MCB9393434.1 DUF4111 domain-containing protein [Acidimicrobiaceae bacterium]